MFNLVLSALCVEIGIILHYAVILDMYKGWLFDIMIMFFGLSGYFIYRFIRKVTKHDS